MPYQLPPGPGRPAGIPNKSTTQAREAIARFVDGNSERLQDWLDRVAVDDPEKAFALFQSVVEYHVPKLARSELVGDKDNPLEVRNLSMSDADIIARYNQISPEKP